MLRFLLPTRGVLSIAVLSTLACTAHAVVPVKLTASDAAAFDQFGFSVSMSGDTAIVGAYLHDGTAGTNQGAAYVFTRIGTSWTQQAKLTASDATGNDRFGFAVSINGDTAIVGAVLADGTTGPNQGAAYVFTRTGTTWTQQAKLTAIDTEIANSLGSSVSINGDTAIVGAEFTTGATGNLRQGTAYVFTRTGTTWTQQARLAASDAVEGANFGTSVSIDGNTAIAGAILSGNTVDTNQGAAYVFTRTGTTWTQQAKLVRDNMGPGYGFGQTVSISGDTALVGAGAEPGTAGALQGSAFVFTRTGTTWTRQAKLTAADAAASDFFGSSVSINGDIAIVGAKSAHGTAGGNQGAAYIFTRTGTTWTQRTKLTAPDAAAVNRFGFSVALEGTTALIGASTFEGTTGVIQGSAFVFTLCLQDLDGDNAVDGADLGLLLGNWGSPGNTDLNGDGTTDGADLGLLLGAWGPC